MEAKWEIGAFMRVMHRLGRVSTAHISSDELNRGEFFCMGAICNTAKEHPEGGGIYVWELAQRMHVLPPAASRTLRELEEKGYIQRSVDREDRRNVRVAPTEAGLAIWTRAEQQAHIFGQRVLNRMGEENMAQLVSLCGRLCDIIEAESDETRKGDMA